MARELSSLCMACLLLGVFAVDAHEILLGPRVRNMCYGIAAVSTLLLLL